ncbi:CoxG family protein [Novosphingobium sp. ZW T3_23]|uniref:CoxG family protein n=1 Tax=Novosphingobium sp. ZW T3_23 TaxID=3378084 RepID=UPI003851EB29
MLMTGEQQVAAPRRKVWEALNDPAVLARCIPGCQSLDKEGDDRFSAVAEVRIGPIGARFKGQVQLSDLDAPNGYTITGTGNGGIAGTAKGGAKVRLSDGDGGGTLVAYEVEAEVGGRMAQLGGPIIDATARNLAGKFFTRFGEVVTGADLGQERGGGPASAVAGEQTAGAGHAASAVASNASAAFAPVSQRRAIWGWAAALVMALVAGFLLGARGMQTEMLAAAVLLVVTAIAAFEMGRSSRSGQGAGQGTGR